MNKVLHTTNKWIFLLAFIFIFSLIFFITCFDKERRVNLHLSNATNTFVTQYKTVYNSYMNISKASHSIIFDSPLITGYLVESQSNDIEKINQSRENLHNLLKNKYKKLTKLGLKQLHFHTKDNRSFLRMHKPQKFGDDLTDIRYSIKYVNEQRKFIHGLEAGRIVHGFRFVYPMYNDNYYLGSVEFSISSKAFVKSIEEAFDTDVHFIANKEVIFSKLFSNNKKTYEESLESPKFLRLKIKEENLSQKGLIHIPKNILRNELAKDIEENMKSKEPFSLYTKYKGETIVATFMPLKNIKEKKVVAYLVSYTKNENIADIYLDFLEINIILALLTILILYFIFLLNKSKQQLLEEQKIQSENSKLDSMRDMIGNIAHHWRQPLSVISTSSSGMLIQNELGLLQSDNLNKNLKTIIDTTKVLSNTIDEFRDFIINENDASSFNIQDMLAKTFIITDSRIDKFNITLVKEINCNETINSVENILVESIVKILNNSIDALCKIEKVENRIIFFDVNKKANNLIISIKDTGGGIEDNIIDNIFEPYFTTKHQAVGTGLGLYTVQSNINNILKGNISVKNSTFIHAGKNFTGAIFNISIPI